MQEGNDLYPLGPKDSQNMEFLHNSKYFPKNHMLTIQERDFNWCPSLPHTLRHLFHHQ